MSTMSELQAAMLASSLFNTEDPRTLDPCADPGGTITSPELIDAHASMVAICKTMADALVKHYPDWLWAIEPDEKGGIINVVNEHLCGLRRWGYTLRMPDIAEGDKWAKLAVQAGGEILERFGMPRGRYRPEMLAQVKRDVRGDPVPLEGRETKEERRKRLIREAIARGEITTENVRTHRLTAGLLRPASPEGVISQ